MIVKRRARQGDRLRIERFVIADAFREDVVFGLGAEELKLLSRGRILLAYEPQVAVVPIKLVLKNGKDGLPANRDRLPAVRLLVLESNRRGNSGQAAAGQRRVGEVPHHFCIERRHVEVQHEGVARGNRVAAVAKSLAVRTIRLYAEQVAQKGPADHRLDAIEPLVGARKLARFAHVGR